MQQARKATQLLDLAESESSQVAVVQLCLLAASCCTHAEECQGEKVLDAVVKVEAYADGKIKKIDALFSNFWFAGRGTHGAARSSIRTLAERPRLRVPGLVLTGSFATSSATPSVLSTSIQRGSPPQSVRWPRPSTTSVASRICQFSQTLSKTRAARTRRSVTTAARVEHLSGCWVVDPVCSSENRCAFKISGLCRMGRSEARQNQPRPSNMDLLLTLPWVIHCELLSSACAGSLIRVQLSTGAATQESKGHERPFGPLRQTRARKQSCYGTPR